MLKWLICAILGHRFVLWQRDRETDSTVYWIITQTPFCTRCGKDNPKCKRQIQ